MASESCSSRPIEAFLEDTLDDATREEFETHLAECKVCQHQLTRSAAEPELWTEVMELLGGDGDVVEDTSLDSTNEGNKQVLSVLDSLAPSDDPGMLGRLGEYEISGVIGVGGMGGVLKGYDRSLQRVVAIKVMAPHLADNGSARQRFQREARAAAAITHDNVIDIYGVAEAAGLPYLVMPFARGPSLQKRLDDSGPMSVTQVLRIGRQIASGLAAAHEQGLVHRDIKPANILLNDGIERLWITDFGVARVMDDASMTQTGLIAGTPQYMSPEQARGESVDHRSDLFSLGSILYTAFTGRPPFRADTAYGILRRITDTDPRDIREINADVPLWMCRIIDRLMAKQASDRYQTAEEVAELLEACLAHLQQPTNVELPETLRHPTKARIESRPIPKSVRNGALAMLSLIGVSFLLFQATAAPDVSGSWKGDTWKSVELERVDGNDWYSGRVTDSDGREGMLQLRWSRVQQRYNGQFRIGDGEFGDITFRRDGAGKLSGAISLAAGANADEETPRLREFVWLSKDAEVADSSELDRAIAAEKQLREEMAKLTEINTELRVQIERQQKDRHELEDQIKKDALVLRKSEERKQFIQQLERELARALSANEPETPTKVEADEALALVEAIFSLQADQRDVGVRLEQVAKSYEASRAHLERQQAQIAAATEQLKKSQKKVRPNDRVANEKMQALQTVLETQLQDARKELDKLAESEDMAKLQLADVTSQIDSLKDVLVSRLKSAEELLQLNQEQFRINEKRYEMGEATKAAGLETEKAVARSRAEVEQMRALLEHVHSIGSKTDEAVSAKQRSLEVQAKVLASELNAMETQLRLVQADYDRVKKLTDEGLVSEVQERRSRGELEAAKAKVEQLKIKLDFFKEKLSQEK
ncbi:MAG: protein kinase [Planctomycetota bacterium]